MLYFLRLAVFVLVPQHEHSVFSQLIFANNLGIWQIKLAEVEEGSDFGERVKVLEEIEGSRVSLLIEVEEDRFSLCRFRS